MLQDNRRSPRTRHDSVLEIYDDSGKFVAGVGHLVDFSKTGACFSSTAELKVGDRFTARLRLLSEGSVAAIARVVWARRKSNAFHYGIMFEGEAR